MQSSFSHKFIGVIIPSLTVYNSKRWSWGDGIIFNLALPKICNSRSYNEKRIGLVVLNWQWKTRIQLEAEIFSPLIYIATSLLKYSRSKFSEICVGGVELFGFKLCKLPLIFISHLYSCCYFVEIVTLWTDPCCDTRLDLHTCQDQHSWPFRVWNKLLTSTKKSHKKSSSTWGWTPGTTITLRLHW